MNKKFLITIVLLSCLSILTYQVGWATSKISLSEAIESSKIRASDLAKAALSFKNTSEQTGTNEYKLEYKFAKAAAKLGNADAMLYMGEMYQGNKITQASTGDNVKRAIKWWEKAAKNGQSRGYTNIGLLYMHQSVPGGGNDFGNIKYDTSTAIKYYKKATKLGDFKAYRYLGLAYQDGLGVSQSDEKAYKNFKKAADLGDSTGKLYQGDYLLKGRGVTQDVTTALKLYQDLIDTNAHDKAAAAYKLGVIYQEGTYVTADIEKAKSYYQIALNTAKKENSSDLETQASLALDKLN